MKKNHLLIIAAVIIAIVATVYFFFLSPVNVFVAIPNTAIAIIETDNWKTFSDKLNANSSGSTLKKTELVQKLSNELSTLQELFGKDEKMKAVITSGKTVASVHLVAADDYDFLFTTSLRGVSDETLLQNIRAMKSIRNVNVRVFKRQKVVDVLLADGKQITFAKLRGILSFSFTSFLTENSVTAITSGRNIKKENGFRKVYKQLSENSGLNLFINFKRADVLLPVMFKEQKVQLLKDISSFADWGGYGISWDKDAIKLSGVAILDDKPKSISTKNILTNSLLNKIPNSAAYVHVSLNEPPGKQTTGYEHFQNWVGEAHAFAILEPLKEDFTEQSVLFVQVKDKNVAAQDLKYLMAINNSITLPVDSMMGTPIYNLQNGDALNRAFGNSLSAFGNTFFAVKNDVAVFCNNTDVLKFCIEKMTNGECIANDANFKDAVNINSTVSDDLVYINPQRSALLFSGLLKENSEFGKYVNSFGSLVFNSVYNKKWITSSVIFKASNDARNFAGTLWKTRLRTLSCYAPQITRNVNTGEQEIFTEDTTGFIYLLTRAGEIIFSKYIGEPIVSSVLQLDYYNNGKLQYIFNTRTHVYIVDHFGNFVASYPLKLSYPATTGLTLAFDSTTKEYSYYIPCSNGAIYGYQSTGRPLYNWSPRAGVGLLKSPVQCIPAAKGSRFLAFNTSGKLMLLDQKGAQIWSVINLPETSQPFSYLKKQDDFVLLNASGNQLTEIASDGNDQIKPLIDSALSFVATSTSDSSYLYFFSNGNTVRAYDQSGTFKASAGLKNARIASICLTEMPGKKYLYATDTSTAQVMVYDLALQQKSAFSLKNLSSFSLSDLFDRRELILVATDSAGNISCTRLE